MAVVDENDKVIGVKARDDVADGDIVRVAVLWLENSKGEVLLQQRALTKKTGAGLWGPAAAGTVEAHETYEGNIIKEAEEELGLTDLTLRKAGKKLFRESNAGFGRMFTYFTATTDRSIDEFTLQPEEVVQIKWVPKDRLLEMIAKHPETYVPSAIYWKELYY